MDAVPLMRVLEATLSPAEEARGALLAAAS